MQPFEGSGDFLESLKSARAETRLSPIWVHGASAYAKRLRKMGLSQMPVSAQSR
jgi:hypothetical protein